MGFPLAPVSPILTSMCHANTGPPWLIPQSHLHTFKCNSVKANGRLNMNLEGREEAMASRSNRIILACRCDSRYTMRWVQMIRLSPLVPLAGKRGAAYACIFSCRERELRVRLMKMMRFNSRLLFPANLILRLADDLERQV